MGRPGAGDGSGRLGPPGQVPTRAGQPVPLNRHASGPLDGPFVGSGLGRFGRRVQPAGGFEHQLAAGTVGESKNMSQGFARDLPVDPTLEGGGPPELRNSGVDFLFF